MRQSRGVKESAIVTSRLMMPTDANIVGNIHGGAIVKYMDEVAAIVAFRHARRNVVTASIDRMNFFSPVYVGNLLIIKAKINFAGKTSMEIGVQIEAEDLITGKIQSAGSCYFTFVALDKRGHPTAIPRVVPKTREERFLYEDAEKRRKDRLLRKTKK
ncbi:MAG: acyl-CoA thioesterase [Candidatus Bathyarchaeia archaeon]